MSDLFPNAVKTAPFEEKTMKETLTGRQAALDAIARVEKFFYWQGIHDDQREVIIYGETLVSGVLTPLREAKRALESNA